VRVGHVAEAVAQQEVILSIESKKKKVRIPLFRFKSFV